MPGAGGGAAGRGAAPAHPPPTAAAAPCSALPTTGHPDGPTVLAGRAPPPCAPSPPHLPQVGFRHAEVRGRQLLHNGRAIMLAGVNRHEHDEAHGKVVGLASMWQARARCARCGATARRAAGTFWGAELVCAVFFFHSVF